MRVLKYFCTTPPKAKLETQSWINAAEVASDWERAKKMQEIYEALENGDLSKYDTKVGR